MKAIELPAHTFTRSGTAKKARVPDSEQISPDDLPVQVAPDTGGSHMAPHADLAWFDQRLSLGR